MGPSPPCTAHSMVSPLLSAPPCLSVSLQDLSFGRHCHPASSISNSSHPPLSLSSIIFFPSWAIARHCCGPLPLLSPVLGVFVGCCPSRHLFWLSGPLLKMLSVLCRYRVTQAAVCLWAVTQEAACLWAVGQEEDLWVVRYPRSRLLSVIWLWAVIPPSKSFYHRLLLCIVLFS